MYYRKLCDQMLDLSNVSTSDLVEALIAREGVNEYQIYPCDDFEIINGNGLLCSDDGPVKILVICD